MEWFHIFIAAIIPSLATIFSALLVWKSAYRQLKHKLIFDQKNEWYKRFQDAINNAFSQKSPLRRRHGISVIALLSNSSLADHEDQKLATLSIDILYITINNRVQEGLL